MYLKTQAYKHVYIYLHIHTNKITLKTSEASWVPVAHAYNPSKPGGRDQEDRSLKPVLGKWDPILKTPNTKKGLAESLKW
jgi:hypothetical protein